MSLQDRPVIGIAGWKNSGKTTMVVRLVTELTRRGHRVATIKHAHHSFDVDPGETDSARHRRAGAAQVAIVSGKRWALMSEIPDGGEPSLTQMLARLEPADIVLVEGFKREPIQKIEVRRAGGKPGPALVDTDTSVFAIAADHAVASRGLPTFDLDDVRAIADLIEMRMPGRG